MSVVSELGSIIALLEAQIPANQASPKNQKLKRSLERDLAKYFKALDTAFPYSKLAAIYNRYVEKE